MKAKSELVGNNESTAEMTVLSPQGEILDIRGESIDPIWAAEFRGFFWGEGTIRVQCGQPGIEKYPGAKWAGYSISVNASIGLRSDDAAVLQEFQQKLGGVIRVEKYRDGSDKTITRWMVSVVADCLRIAYVLKSPTGLPFFKAKQRDIWEIAVRAKLRAGGTAGSRYTPEDRALMLWAEEELKRMRKWAG